MTGTNQAPWEMEWGRGPQPAPAQTVQQMPWEMQWGTNQPEGETVIATTPDGGRVIERDGQRMFVGDAYSTTDPERIATILEGATPAEAYRGGVMEDVVQQNPVASRGATALQGVPFVGSYIDEAVTPVFGEDAGRAVRLSQQAMQETRPGQATALQVGGTVAGAVPMIAASGASVPFAATSRGTQMAGMAGLGAAAGGAEGLIYGAGDQSGQGRGSNALQQGAWGAGLGGVIGAGSVPLQQGLTAVLSRLRGQPVRQVASELGVSPSAAAVISRAIEADDIEGAIAALQRNGNGAMLADASQAGRELLDASAATGGRPGVIARNAVEGRVVQEYANLNTALDDILGAPTGQDTALATIRQGTAAERQVLYDTAYSQPIDYSEGAGRRLESLLRRVDPSAIRSAERLMRTEGEESAQIMAEIAENGSVSFTQMPDVRTIHYIMRGLGDLANREQGAGALGGTSAVGRSVEGLRRQIGDALSEAVPDFGTAQARFADIARESEATQLGYDLLRPIMTPDRARRALAGATEAERTAARAGMRNYIEDQVARVRAMASDPNQDAREALQAMRLMTSRQSRANIQTLLRRAEAERLFTELDSTIGALDLRASIARNSATAIRGNIREAVAEFSAPNAVEILMDGSPLEAGRRVIRALTGSSSEAQALREAGLFEEISRALTETRGPQAQQALRIIQQAQGNGGVIVDGRAEYLGRVLARTFAVQGHQQGMQALRVR